MKKTLLIIAVVSMAMASCKKDRTCECSDTYTDTSGQTTTQTGIVITMKKVSKSDAKSECQKTTTVDVDNNGKTTTDVMDCKLK